MPKSSNLIPIKKLVNRGGKSYVTTVYVSPQEYKEHLKRNSDSSKKRHINESGHYNPERVRLHKKIITNIVSSCPKPLPGEKPTAILLLGGAASGKSTVVNKFIKPKYGVNFGTLNVDDIKELIPEYKNFIHTDVILAANRVHEESSDIGYVAKDKIINQGRNFIFDAVLGNKEKAKELIDTLRNKGYNIKLVGVNVNAEDALNRAKLRALGNGDGKGGSGRYVPDEILVKGHRGSTETFEEIKDLVDDYELYDNNVELGNDPIKVLDSSEVYREDLYIEFKNKKNIIVEDIIKKQSVLQKAINSLRQLFSKSINPISEDTGQELTDIDISRIRLKTKSDIIADLLQKGQSLQENYNEALVQYNDLTKGNTNEAILKRLNTRIDQIEQSYLQDKYNQVQQLKKVENDLYSCIEDHCQLLKAIDTSQTGDFKYKKYLLNTLNRTRDTMPQIDSDNIDDVILHFQGKSPDSKVTKENISLSDLKFAQNEINEDKVLEILENIDPDKLTRFLVSKDNYIIDGNHRICALCEIDEEMEVPCYKIHLDAKEAIRRLNLMKITRNDDISKGQKANIGEIRTWSDGKRYQKQGDGSWREVVDKRNSSKEENLSDIKFDNDNYQYYVRYSDNIKEDLERNWSSWSFGNNGIEGDYEDIENEFNSLKEEGGNFSISGMDFWVDESSSIESYWIEKENGKRYREISFSASEDGIIRELYPNYWVLVDNFNTKGGISAHELSDNLDNLQEALDKIKNNKGKYDGTGEGESFDADYAEVIYSKGNMHIIRVGGEKIAKSEEDESFETIQKAFNDDLITPEQYYQAKQQYDLIKARSGVYADTAQNRKLKRVGQKYGSNGQQDQSNAKQGQNNDSKQPKSYSDAELQDYAKNASQQDLERQIKESSDPKIREYAHKELDRRNKEEAVNEDKEQEQK